MKTWGAVLTIAILGPLPPLLLLAPQPVAVPREILVELFLRAFLLLVGRLAVVELALRFGRLALGRGFGEHPGEGFPCRLLLGRFG